MFDPGEPSTSGGIVFAVGSTDGLDSSSVQGNFNLGSVSDQKTRRGSGKQDCSMCAYRCVRRGVHWVHVHTPPPT